MSTRENPRGTWSYDGSFEGLIMLAHRAYSETSYPEAVANALASAGELFALLGPAPLRGIAESSPENSRRMVEEAASELRSFSGEFFDIIARIWMSEEALELPLFRVCAEAGRHGSEVLANYGNVDLRAISRASRRVICEIHKLTGLARFFPVGGLFAAALEPDANVVAALVPHFARRFGSQDFALIDLRRRLACSRRGGRFESSTGEEALELLSDFRAAGDGDEQVLLWKRYFKAAENPSRRNPELQRRLMPRRYWRFLPELSD